MTKKMDNLLEEIKKLKEGVAWLVDQNTLVKTKQDSISGQLTNLTASLDKHKGKFDAHKEPIG